MGNGRGGRKSFINIFFPLNAIVSTIFLFEITNNYFVPSSRDRGNFTCKDETLNTFLTVFKFWQKEKRTFNSKTFGSVLCSPLDKGRLDSFPLLFFSPTLHTYGREGRKQSGYLFGDEIDSGRGKGVAGKTNSNEGHTSNASLSASLCKCRAVCHGDLHRLWWRSIWDHV